VETARGWRLSEILRAWVASAQGLPVRWDLSAQCMAALADIVEKVLFG